jgi:hypothetical protein
VIGVVRDVPLQYVRGKAPQAVAYTLYRQQPEQFEGGNAGAFGHMTFFVRSAGDPMSLVPAVRQAIAAIDPNRPPGDFQTLTAFVEPGMRTRGVYVSMLGLFAFMAVMLAAVSVYGVMTLLVGGRTAIRKETFAARARQVVGDARGALRPVAIGLLLGIAGALTLTRLIESQLWGVTATDPATFATVTALLIVVSVAACLIPLRRALHHP